jgi:tetratricopeptide (TPR) repeat protein
LATTQQDSGQGTLSSEHLYESGFAQRCAGEYAEARATFNQVLEAEPGHLNSRWQLALIEGFEGDFDASLESLRTLAAEAPENLDIRYDFAMTEMMLGFFDEACAEFRAILELDPEHEKAKAQLAYCS